MYSPDTKLTQAALIFLETTKDPRQAESWKYILRQLFIRILAKEEDLAIARNDELQATLANLSPTPPPGTNLLLKIPRKALSYVIFRSLTP